MKSIKAAIAATLLVFSFAMPAQGQMPYDPDVRERMRCMNECEETRKSLRLAAAALRLAGREREAKELEDQADEMNCIESCRIGPLQ